MVAVAAGEKTAAAAESRSPRQNSNDLCGLHLGFPNNKTAENQDSRPPV